MTLFRAHFLAFLPVEVRSVLAGREINDLNKLAETADRVMEAKGIGSKVAPVAVQAVRTTTVDTRRPLRDKAEATLRATREAPTCASTTSVSARGHTAANFGAYCTPKHKAILPPQQCLEMQGPATSSSRGRQQLQHSRHVGPPLRPFQLGGHRGRHLSSPLHSVTARVEQ